jgi:hypothetical protein
MQTQCISKRTRMAMSVIIACALVTVNSSAWAANHNRDKEKTCSLQTLDGDYGFTIEGILIDSHLPGGSAQLRGVVLQHYDGNGHITMSDHVVVGGVAPPEEWRPGTGTYTVNPDCTGRAELSIAGGPGPVVYFVIVKHGEIIRQVVNGSAIIATGNKLD